MLALDCSLRNRSQHMKRARRCRVQSRVAQPIGTLPEVEGFNSIFALETPYVGELSRSERSLSSTKISPLDRSLGAVTILSIFAFQTSAIRPAFVQSRCNGTTAKPRSNCCFGAARRTMVKRLQIEWEPRTRRFCQVALILTSRISTLRCGKLVVFLDCGFYNTTLTRLLHLACDCA